MKGFVRECRREWKLLGVPDAVANEMASDLAADLAEAEADGASHEDVLGSAAFDPRSFAAAWAAARGVTRVPSPSRRPPSRELVLAGVAALLAVALGGGLAMLASRTGVAISASPAGGRPPAAHFGLQDASGVGIHAFGLFIVVIGLIGLVALLAWWWLGRSGPRSRTYVDEGPRSAVY